MWGGDDPVELTMNLKDEAGNKWWPEGLKLLFNQSFIHSFIHVVLRTHAWEKHASRVLEFFWSI